METSISEQNKGIDDTAKSPSVTKKIEGEEVVSTKELKLLSPQVQNGDIESENVSTASPSKRSSDHIPESHQLERIKQ